MSRASASLVKASALAVLLLLAVEVSIRTAYAVRNSMVQHVVLPYTAAQDFGPVPPWMDGLRILEPDEVLSWRNRRNARRRYLDVFGPVRTEQDRARLLQRFLPSTPAYLRDNPVWEVSLNSRGFRDREFAAEKPPDAFRILCIGDSWTFGANVDQADAYPQRLETRLREEFPGAQFEVLNLGVMGYSSFQGLRLLRRTGMALRPDFVLIGFGMNDGLVVGWRDKDHVERPEAAPAALSRALGRIEIVKLLRYVWTRLRHEPWSIGDYMRNVAASVGTPDEAWVGAAATEVASYDGLEPYTRVAPNDYEQNIRAMVRLAQSRGAGVMLLYNSLWNTPYRDALRRISDTEGIPLVDSQALIRRARAAVEDSLERELDLRPGGRLLRNRSDGDEVEVVFRVHTGEWPVASAIYIAGTHPALGDATPNAVAMYDDGTHGDQRAGDHVWSYTARLKIDTTVLYVYTNSGEEGRWEGLDVPDLRRLTVTDGDSAGRLFRPIESFGQLYLQADGWHTNAVGYGLIGDAVLNALTHDPTIEAHLGRGPERAR
jgi:lysophospholipase L1-like esterase